MDRPICHKIALRATVHRKRFKMIEELGDKIRQDIINTLKGKDSVSIWRKVSDQCHITWLWGFRWHSSCCSGSVFQRLWSSWCYPESARVLWHCRSDLCCVLRTTSSNTGVFSGAIVLLPQSWTLPPLWFLCRRHMLECNLSLHGGVDWRVDKGPHIMVLHKVKNEIDKMEELVKFTSKTL